MVRLIEIHKHDMLGQVRTVTHKGDIFFAARDVCECIGILAKNTSRTIVQNVDAEDVCKFQAETAGGKQTLVYVNEAGLYQLIFSGRSEKSKAFKRWVAQDVLPSIRKTGKYELPEGVTSVEEMHEIQRMVDQYLGKA